MNIDLDAQFPYGDAGGLRNFLLTHRFVHNQIQDALQAQFGVSFSTFPLTSSSAEDEWARSMQAGKRGEKAQPSQSLNDWLALHANLHSGEYATLLGTGTIAPDLSTVDFSKADQFNDWMYVHQTMHDFENLSLGLT